VVKKLKIFHEIFFTTNQTRPLLCATACAGGEHRRVGSNDAGVQGRDRVGASVRGRYRTRAGVNLFRGVPINSDAPGWFRINLLYPDMPTVSLLIDEINCYLIAFRRGNGDWLHFDDHDLPNDVEGIKLGFDSSYGELLEHIDKYAVLPLLHPFHLSDLAVLLGKFCYYLPVAILLRPQHSSRSTCIWPTRR